MFLLTGTLAGCHRHSEIRCVPYSHRHPAGTVGTDAVPVDVQTGACDLGKI